MAPVGCRTTAKEYGRPTSTSKKGESTAMGTEVAAAAVLDDIDEDRMRAITAGSMAAAFTEAVEGMSWVWYSRVVVLNAR